MATKDVPIDFAEPDLASGQLHMSASAEVSETAQPAVAHITGQDFAKTLQARILSGPTAGETCHASHRAEIPDAEETHIASLEQALVEAEIQREEWRQRAQTATTRIEVLEKHIAEIAESLAKADALPEEWRREGRAAAKRADNLVAELIELTSELVEMSKRMAEQVAATDKLRTEFDEFRSRCWWWEHATG
jgi:chromosome segregation ATPase